MSGRFMTFMSERNLNAPSLRRQLSGLFGRFFAQKTEIESRLKRAYNFIGVEERKSAHEDIFPFRVNSRQSDSHSSCYSRGFDCLVQERLAEITQGASSGRGLEAGK